MTVRNLNMPEFESTISGVISENIKLQNLILERSGTIKFIFDMIINVFKSGNKILIFGNGGSAADAQHIAAEFVNRFRLERPPLPVIALTGNTCIVTAIANDYEFKDIFSKQIRALGKPNDLAWGISTSGTSQNIIRGLETAKMMELKTLSFTGEAKGKHACVSDIDYCVPSSTVARIQEIHLCLAHIICELVDCYYINNHINGGGKEKENE